MDVSLASFVVSQNYRDEKLAWVKGVKPYEKTALNLYEKLFRSLTINCLVHCTIITRNVFSFEVIGLAPNYVVECSSLYPYRLIKLVLLLSFSLFPYKLVNLIGLYRYFVFS